MLPPLIQRFITLIGHTKTMLFVKEFGGQLFYVPRTDRCENWHALAEIIGERATRRLADSEYAAHEHVYVPMCFKALKIERNRKMIERCDALVREGNTIRAAVNVLTREFRPISYRQVQSIINQPVPAATQILSQPDLF